MLAEDEVRGSLNKALREDLITGFRQDRILVAEELAAVVALTGGRRTDSKSLGAFAV